MSQALGFLFAGFEIDQRLGVSLMNHLKIAENVWYFIESIKRWCEAAYACAKAFNVPVKHSTVSFHITAGDQSAILVQHAIHIGIYLLFVWEGVPSVHGEYSIGYLIGYGKMGGVGPEET